MPLLFPGSFCFLAREHFQQPVQQNQFNKIRRFFSAVQSDKDHELWRGENVRLAVCFSIWDGNFCNCDERSLGTATAAECSSLECRARADIPGY